MKDFKECYKCPKRHVGCHSQCNYYKQNKAKQQADRLAEKVDKQAVLQSALKKFLRE